MNGYFGRVLRIDVTVGRHWEEPLEVEVLRAFVGGSGLATYLLYRFAPAGIDPLDPANPLIFASSPLVGTRVTTTAKLAVAAKSPQTGLIGDSLSSSHLALELKRLGCDAVVITGRAERPTLLVIQTDEPGIPSVTFLSASQLWGKSTTLTADEVRRGLGAQFRVAAIGPAGERLVRFATIANDGRHAGRTGTGAVM
ncbi:MAG: aldehyde:ferredoxin oxidoreductase, partial [Chloroflexi bacterium]|nr:aldehyde:ferredoxin oxidoreductase [Chloroflexota bacterium]